MLRLPSNYYHPQCYWAHMVTFRCNGGCSFCILNGRGKAPIPPEMDVSEILGWWNGLEHQQGQRLSLIGGEPFKHKDILEIVAGLEGYSLTITTNCASEIHKTEGFYKDLKPHYTSTLRVNTSFHPHLIDPAHYVKVVTRYQQAGHHLDQIALVNYPGVLEKYKDEIEIVKQGLGRLRIVPYLGFYNEKEGPNAMPDTETIEPNENYYDKQAASQICGLHDMAAYRDICGQSVPRRAECVHPFKSLIIGPQGNHYHCHYKLYYDIEPVCNISNWSPVSRDYTVPRPETIYTETRTCDYYGFCNWCDVPRVGCVKNPTAREIPEVVCH